MDSLLTWQHQCNETAKTSFISHSQHWQLMSPMWCVLAPGRGCGRRIVLKWTLLRYIDQDKAVVKRVGGTLVCLLAEKLWNNAKFPIREPCKVTTVCSLSANWILPLQAALEGGQPGSEGSGTCTTDSRYQGSVTKCSSGWWFIRSGWKKEKANRLFLAANYSKGPQKQECQRKKKLLIPPFCLTETLWHFAIGD